MRRGSVGEAMFHDIHGHYCQQSPQPPQHQQQCNSTSCLRRAAATTELCGGVVWSLSSTAASARGGAIQQQQIFCTNLASSTGVKYTSVLSRVCMCVTVQEGDILLYIKYKFSSVVVTRAAKLHDTGVWYSQPLPPLPTPLRLLLLPGCLLGLYGP